ncbi:MAG: ribosome recycling factor [Deltaproteobacteria bacterium]|nr:ribosome recycling factor [Deltaproteobacteria bacterium]
MSSQKNLEEARVRMGKAIEALKGEFAKLRTGRASPNLLDHVVVDCYGSSMPLNQIASLSIPESRTIVITPWDKSTLSEIDKAIKKSDLGLNPINDGKVVRIGLPSPTEERRKELVKQAKKMAEEGRVAVRNVRREANEVAKKLQKGGKISEDELRKGEVEIQKLTDQFTSQVDQLLTHKEKEIMEI